MEIMTHHLSALTWQPDIMEAIKSEQKVDPYLKNWNMRSKKIRQEDFHLSDDDVLGFKD